MPTDDDARDTRDTDTEDGDLQFERADYEGNAPTECAVCAEALAGEYYALGDKPACLPCTQQLSAQLNRRVTPGALAAALGLGLLATILGGVLWGLVGHFTGKEFGIIAVAVGWLVGAAVRRGSGHRGGIPYQLLAVGLTWLGIGIGNTPIVVDVLSEGGPVDAFLVIGAFFLALLAPFLSLLELPAGLLGVIIVAFALWEAWAMNRRPKVEITGPHALVAAEDGGSSFQEPGTAGQDDERPAAPTYPVTS